MAYRVGEAAEILGISAQGVRFFERKNYIKSHREENGYRTFERGDITIAQQIQDYASVGFTLQEAAQMVWPAIWILLRNSFCHVIPE